MKTIELLVETSDFITDGIGTMLGVSTEPSPLPPMPKPIEIPPPRNHEERLRHTKQMMEKALQQMGVALHAAIETTDRSA